MIALICVSVRTRVSHEYRETINLGCLRLLPGLISHSSGVGRTVQAREIEHRPEQNNVAIRVAPLDPPESDMGSDAEGGARGGWNR